MSCVTQGDHNLILVNHLNREETLPDPSDVHVVHEAEGVIVV